MDQKKGTVPVSPEPESNLPDVLACSLARLVPAYPDAALCVALSGGVDSVALLAAAQALALDQPRLRLRAIHVDHGLQAESRNWSRFCSDLCRRLQVPLLAIELGLDPARGASVEAEARRERYGALASALAPGECLLTAHHADDQLETVLLQLLRGAGVAGLAAMPGSSALGAGLHLRPLLGVRREQLLAHAVARGLDWTEDPMNTQPRFDRAYLRHQVLPALRARWPAAAQTVGRSAGHLAEALRLLEALAAADGAPLLDDAGRLEVAGLLQLPNDRQANLLRWWIAGQGLGLPSTARLRSVMDDVIAARADGKAVVTWPTGEVRRYLGRLHAMTPLGALPPAGWERDIRPGEAVELPGGMGRVRLDTTRGEGIALAAIDLPLTLCFGRPRPRGLQERLRRSRVLPWMRARMPLLVAGDRVLCVPGLWLAEDVTAQSGDDALLPDWQGGPTYR
jgi:tRNA(Ile)-lysidine synthase